MDAARVGGVAKRRDRKARPWEARPHFQGRKVFLGTFATYDEAVEAVLAFRAGNARTLAETDTPTPVPAGHVLRGVSTLYDHAGNAVQQWVKTRADDRLIDEAMRAMVDELKQELPRLSPVPSFGNTNDDLANVYVVSDFHLGMFAWREETGADWDLELAERTLVSWFERAIDQSPASSVAYLAQLGDFAHWDGLLPMTPTSGHVLDADTRFQKLVRVMIRLLRRVIDMLLRKHSHVFVLNCEGNHDIATSLAAREWFHALYENEPRVTVDRSPRPYYCHVFGDVLLAFHHGHLAKPQDLPAIVASMFAPDWGATLYRYAHCGHRHHREVKEHHGIVVEQHPTLAARDAYASRHGYLAQRAAHVVTYHKRHGEVGRVTLGPECVK